MTNDEHIEVLRKELSAVMDLDLKVESLQIHPVDAEALGIVPGNYTRKDGTTFSVRVITKSDPEQ